MPTDVLPLVSRIADCEPPAVGGPPSLPRVAPVRPRRTRQTQATPVRPAEDPRRRAAAAFADAALRRVLEVIDRRRPMAQLRPLLSTGLVDSLLSAAMRGTPDKPARLRRVRVQLIGDHAAEVSAMYSRAERVHAIACRIEQVRTVTGPRWQMVALHMG